LPADTHPSEVLNGAPEAPSSAVTVQASEPASDPKKKKKKAKLKIVHQIPGRIRMKVPSAKNNPEQLEAYKATLALIPGIEGVETNPETGSIVLKYDPDRHHDFHAGFEDHCRDHHDHHHKPPTNEIDALASKIQAEAEYLAEHSHAAKVVVDFFKNADRQVKLASHNTLDLKMVLALGVIGVTVFEVGATAATPVWVTLALFGMNHFVEMQEEMIEAQKAARAAALARA
jgi:hypothetical protein